MLYHIGILMVLSCIAETTTLLTTFLGSLAALKGIISKINNSTLKSQVKLSSDFQSVSDENAYPAKPTRAGLPSSGTPR
jgi:uncharacterized membrane protein HdeD (DUF308 family)